MMDADIELHRWPLLLDSSTRIVGVLAIDRRRGIGVVADAAADYQTNRDAAVARLARIVDVAAPPPVVRPFVAAPQTPTQAMDELMDVFAGLHLRPVGGNPAPTTPTLSAMFPAGWAELRRLVSTESPVVTAQTSTPSTSANPPALHVDWAARIRALHRDAWIELLAEWLTLLTTNNNRSG